LAYHIPDGYCLGIFINEACKYYFELIIHLKRGKPSDEDGFQIKHIMGNVSTGAKLSKVAQDSNKDVELLFVPSSFSRVFLSLASMAIEALLGTIKSKQFSLLAAMIGILKIAVMALFVIMLIDAFYILAVGRSLLGNSSLSGFDDFLRLLNGGRQEEDDSSTQYWKKASKNALFGIIEMLPSPQGKELFKISDLDGPPIDFKTIKANYRAAEQHIKEFGPGKKGNYQFQLQRWAYYQGRAKQFLDEKEAFFKEGTHKIYTKSEHGEAIVFEGTFEGALEAAQRYLKGVGVSGGNTNVYRASQLEKSPEFLEIAHSVIYDAEKVDYRNNTIIKNQYLTWN
jgi:hypothetical protein